MNSATSKITRSLFAAVMIAVVGSAGEVKAAFSISFAGANLPGGTVVINDNVSGTPGDLNNGITNNIRWSYDQNPGNPGLNYSTNGTVTLTVSSSGVSIRLNTLNFTNDTSNGTPVNFNDIVITVTATGLTGPTGPGQFLASNLTVNSGVTGTNYSLESSISNNAASVTSTYIPGNFPGTVSNGIAVSPVSGFDLVSTFRINTLNAGDTFSLTGSLTSLTSAPVPMTAIAGLSAMPMLGIFGLLRRKTATKP